MNYTTHFHYNLPEASDYINIQDLNDNFTLIDSKLYDTWDTADTTSTALAALTTFVPIASQVVASAGSVDVSLSAVDWNDWREVAIWIEGFTGSSSQTSCSIRFNDEDGSTLGRQYCWAYVPLQTYGNVSSSTSAGIAFFDLFPDTASVKYASGGVIRLTLFPSKTPALKVNLRTEGPVNMTLGGSNTISYSGLNKIRLDVTDFTGVTIRVMGVK